MGRSGSGIAPNTNMNIIARNVKALPPRARVNGFRTVGLVFEVIVATPSGGGGGGHLHLGAVWWARRQWCMREHICTIFDN